MKKQDAIGRKPETTLGRKLFVSSLIIIGLLVVSALIAALLSDDYDDADANTAVISLRGVITADGDDGGFGGSGASATELVRELEKARDDSRIEAVILDINSPGGSAVASDEIGQAVKDVRAQNKTVVAVIHEVGASGAYWVASSSDHVIANRMSITGSIGVISSYLQFDRFLADWNVTYNRLTAGEEKDVGDPFTELTPQGRLFLQGKLDRVHEFFIAEVAANRNMTVERVRPLADGRFYLGIEALDVGLVDQLGGMVQAQEYIEARTGHEVTLVYYEPERSFLEDLLGIASGAHAPSIADIARHERASLQARADVPVPAFG